MRSRRKAVSRMATSLSPSTSLRRGETLIDHRCKWKARLILSEVEGSGPISAGSQFFIRLKVCRCRHRARSTASTPDNGGIASVLLKSDPFQYDMYIRN
jgi:hypothetical protein